MNRIEIKTRAKAALGGNIFHNNWLMVLLVLLVQGLLLSIAGSVISGIGSLLVTGPLAYGISVILLKKVRTDEKVDFANLFKGFTEDFGQNLALGLLIGLFVALWSLLFVIPGIVKSYAYSMAFYIKADHPDWDWRACLNESKRITQGHKMELFVLDLSFLGWYWVGSLCLGVGVLWVYPYHETAKALYYEEMKGVPAIEG